MKMNRLLAAVLAAATLTAAFTACGESISKENSDLEEVSSAETTTTVTGETGTGSAETSTTAAAEEGTATTAAETAAAGTDAAAQEESSAAEEDSQAEQTDAPAAEQPAQQETQAPAEQPEEKEPYLFDEIKLGGDVTAYVAKNTGCEKDAAPSCLGSGEDRTYTYPDFVIQTYFENGTDTIREIQLVTDKISTRKGIHIGSTIAELTAAYGEPAEAGFYSYDTEDGHMEVIPSVDGAAVGVIKFIKLG